MKFLFLSLFATLLVLTSAKTGCGQYRSLWGPQKRDRSGWHLSLSSVGIGGGAYAPSFGFWNNESEIRYWNQKFNPAPLFLGFVEVRLRSRLLLRGEAGFSTTTARQTAIHIDLGGGEQSKEISLVPVSGILLYEITEKTRMVPYIGAGAGIILVNSTHEKTLGANPPTSVKSTASDYLFYGIGGIKYTISRRFFVAAEVREALGKYIENVTNTHLVPELQDISLNGLQVQLTLNCSFGKSYYWQKSFRY